MFMLMCCQHVFTIFALHSSYIVYVYISNYTVYQTITYQHIQYNTKKIQNNKIIKQYKAIHTIQYIKRDNHHSNGDLKSFNV